MPRLKAPPRPDLPRAKHRNDLYLTDKTTILKYILDRAPFRSRYVIGRWIGSYYPRNLKGSYVLESPPAGLWPKQTLFVYTAARRLWYGNVDLLPPSLTPRGKGTRRRMAPFEQRAVMVPGTGLVMEVVQTRLRPSEILLEYMPRVPELIGHGRGAPFHSRRYWRKESGLQKLIEKARKERIGAKRPGKNGTKTDAPTDLPNKPVPIPKHLRTLQNIYGTSEPDPASFQSPFPDPPTRL